MCIRDSQWRASSYRPRALSPGADPLSSTSVTTSLITSCHRRFLVISGSSATRWNVATVANSLAVRPSGGARTWTVVGEGYQTVIPVEDWLEAHRYLWSPNTVRGYATSLVHWWDVPRAAPGGRALERGRRAGGVGVPVVVAQRPHGRACSRPGRGRAGPGAVSSTFGGVDLLLPLARGCP